MKEWEKTCREKTGLGFETFKTITHCDAETLDALLEAAPGSTKGTMYFDWLMEYLSLAQSGKNADVKTVVDDIDALIAALPAAVRAGQALEGAPRVRNTRNQEAH